MLSGRVQRWRKPSWSVKTFSDEASLGGLAGKGFVVARNYAARLNLKCTLYNLNLLHKLPIAICIKMSHAPSSRHLLLMMANDTSGNLKPIGAFNWGVETIRWRRSGKDKKCAVKHSQPKIVHRWIIDYFYWMRRAPPNRERNYKPKKEILISTSDSEDVLEKTMEPYSR